MANLEPELGEAVREKYAGVWFETSVRWRGEDPDRGAQRGSQEVRAREGAGVGHRLEAAEVVFKVRLRAEDSPPVPNQAELSVSSFGMARSRDVPKKASLKLAIQGGWGPRSKHGTVA